MTDEAFAEWIAFARVEPFGPWADDQRNAMHLAQHAEMHRDTKKRRKPFTTGDFMTCRVKKQEEKRVPLRVLREQMEAVLGKPDGQHK